MPGYLLVLPLLLFRVCPANAQNAPTAVLVGTYQKEVPAHVFEGDWADSSSVWSSSQLQINDDNSFVFHDHGCYGQHYTCGKWHLVHNVIVLQSDDSYKPPKPHPKKVQHFRAGNGANWSVELPDTLAGGPILKPTMWSDTVKVYFDHVVLKYEPCTLVCQSKTALLDELRLHKRPGSGPGCK